MKGVIRSVLVAVAVLVGGAGHIQSAIGEMAR